MKQLFLFIQISFLGTVISQQDFGLEVVKELCSEKYHGRGYVNDGHIKASRYIADRFDEFDLKKFDETYFQKFKIKANTFPDSVSVYIDGEKLETGVDYLIVATSGTAKGEYTTQFVNRKNLPLFISDLKSEKLLFNEVSFVLDNGDVEDKDTLQMFRELSKYLASKAPVFIIKDTKFTWSVGRESLTYPIIEIKKDKLPYTVRKVRLNIRNEFKTKIETQNVIGYIEGKKKTKFLIVSAHYDHLGQMGSEAYFPGANDNASGVAMLIYLSKHFSENKPKFSVVFMAFGAEEAGILGSKHYVENPLFPLKDIRFVLNCDIMGTGDEGITVVNGTVHKKEFKKLAVINLEKEYLTKVKVRGRAANSDHYWFSQRQIPAVFIYTMGGIKAYHDVFDKSETLPLTEFADLSNLLIDFINSF